MSSESETTYTPQLRFPEFSNNWDISTIGNIAKIDTGNKDTQDRVDSGKYPFFVRSNTVEKINEFAFDGEAILTSGDGVGVGKNFHYIVGKFNYHQRVYSIHNFTKPTNGKFVYYYFADKFYRRVLRLSAKNSVDSVRMSMISDMPISTPTKPEQTKIATFLTSVDNKIEQLSKKQELLGEYKKGLMQQIFSQAIRFKADDGSEFPDWEETKLENIYCFQPTNSLSRALLNDNNGMYRNIHYGDIHTKFPSILDVSKVDIPYVTGDRMFPEYQTCRTGDVLIADASEDYADIGKAIEIINDNNELVVSGLHTLMARPRESIIAQGFSAYLFKSPKVRMDIKRIAQGAKVLGIGIRYMKDLPLDFPSIPEQTKIAIFLSSVDNKIEQVGKQLDESKQFKKALLQQMFV